jgi:putative ABC transport system permease protein
MTAAVLERAAPASGAGGGPPRRAMTRWAWRLFRREWRQQALVLALLIAAIAATTVGLGVVSNASNLKADPTFGTSNTIITLPGSDARLTTDIAAIRQRFGTVEVITHRDIPIPGSVSTFDLRAESVDGPFASVTLHLDTGRFPSGPGEVAVTSDVAKEFNLQVGGSWVEGGRTLKVVGLVENPLDLLDQFALLPAGQVNSPTTVSVLLDANQQSLDTFRLPSGTGLTAGSRDAGSRVHNEVLVLLLSTIGLLFIGLLAVAGFTVIAGRRLRGLGMLGSIGATDRHVRLVLLANGAVVGATAAIAGTFVGLVAWFAFVPTLRRISEHRVDPFSLPWWAIAGAMVLTFMTAVGAAWWPARTSARISVVAALSGRPPAPQPVHRFAAVGVALLGAGIVLLGLADQRREGFILGGTVAVAIGLLFLAPVAIRAVAFLARRSSVSIRLAVRDLVRYQARSGAALGAVTLAIAIAATIAIAASAAMTPPLAGNLPTDQLVIHLTPAVSDFQGVPSLSAGQLQEVTAQIDRLAAAIHANLVLPLDAAYNPQGGNFSPQPGTSGGILSPQSGSPGLEGVGPGTAGGGGGGYPTPALARVTKMGRGEDVSFAAGLYVATPAVLEHFGIPASGVDPASDIVSSRTDLSGLQIFYPGVSTRETGIADPKIQNIGGLPLYTSDPGTLITAKAMRALGLQSTAAAWLIQTPQPLTVAQIQTAQNAASAAGLYVETRTVKTSLAPLRNWSTAAGILLALGVLAMTVGLIRNETANDLRTLAATGASTNARRSVTGATAGVLALLGALLGTAGAYAAMLAWYRSDLSPLARVPVVDLVVILLGLPMIAAAAGWLLAGGEPRAMGRRPLE